MRVPYAQSVCGQEEIDRVVKAIKENRLAPGPDVLEFERRIANLFGKSYGVMVNSGSSANLLALEILDLPEGSEVITPALTFATTVAPILQKRLKPVFVDVELGTYLPNIDTVIKLLRKRIRTSVILLPSLIGNIPDLILLDDAALFYGALIIEDSCDTLGARIGIQSTGIFSDMSTTSFYGSHIITAGGGGGMLCLASPTLDKKARILRGWGRQSALFGESEALADRFNTKIDNLDYDAKFIFSEIGYNFQSTELCAAFGLAQLDRLADFSAKRKANFARLLHFFKLYPDMFILPIQTPNTETNWLAFPLTIKTDKFTRKELTMYLEEQGIQTRPIFTGNITRQPAFKHLGRGDFPNADYIMERAFLIGCHQGLTEDQLTYIEETFAKFLNG